MPMIHLLIADEINDWDPFSIGNGSYETEIADIIQAVHELDNATALAVRIQGIFEFSFEETIPIAACKKAAERMLAIKASGSCSL